MEDSELASLGEILTEAVTVGGCNINYVLDNLDINTLRRFGLEALEMRIRDEVISDTASENLKAAKAMAKKFLLEVRLSDVDEAVLLLAEKYGLNYAQKNALSKAIKDYRSEHALLNSDSTEYDLNSMEGRALIMKDFADTLIERQRSIGRPIKCINGKLRMFTEGIYPDSEEAIAFIKNDLVGIGLENNVNLPPSLVKQTLEHIEMRYPVRMEDCEPNADFVVVLNNGILDMRTWEFRDFNPDEVYFSKIPVDYKAEAPTPSNFVKAVAECFKGNEQQIPLFQELFGYCLTKTYKYQDIFYLVGDGGNGKGSMMRVLIKLVGSHNCSSFSLYQLTDGEHIDYNIAGMRGKHANICGDVGTAKVKNTENIKKLSSHTDYVTGRNPGEKPVQFISYAKLIFLMNRAPETEAHTTGDNRRTRVINFINSFSEKAGEIKDIHAVIEEAGEMPGILNWAIEGLKRLEANKGFTDVRTISQRAIEYDKKSNTVKYFVQDRLYECRDEFVHTSTMLDAYTKFRKKVGGGEYGADELKERLIKEFKNVGWEDVKFKQATIESLHEPLKQKVKERVPGSPKTAKIYMHVALIPDEDDETPKKGQTTMPDFKDQVITVCETDEKANEMLTMDEETYMNGDVENE